MTNRDRVMSDTPTLCPFPSVRLTEQYPFDVSHPYNISRPILKRSSQSCPDNPINDNLPPLRIPTQCPNTVPLSTLPILARTFSAYSSSTYDRSPIVVLPNICALPARGCPDRTYLPGCTVPASPSTSPDSNVYKSALKAKGTHIHPRRALPFGLVPEPAPDCATHPLAVPQPLVSDVSSESDESDGTHLLSFMC